MLKHYFHDFPDIIFSIKVIQTTYRDQPIHFAIRSRTRRLTQYLVGTLHLFLLLQMIGHPLTLALRSCVETWPESRSLDCLCTFPTCQGGYEI